MVEIIKDYARVEQLMSFVSDSQKFARPKDKLTALVDKYSQYISEELHEDELEYVVAAKMPDVPKYKKLK